ncbi:class I SAM-dependent methyltransferase [Trichlorobacter lovleyi]|uniref:class I SAM-dependent methyltransferase n=1 Tax=Trichlorobacter lovleyi TaxID=313985 RepID=UPI0023F19D3D|nr:class I SAM-dependent methyltransferase [Trichlorobacter lovleyi]
MNIQHIQDILFRSSTNEEEALQIKNLCELYISKFWEHTYYQSMANYGHHVWHPHQLDLAMWHRDRNPHFAERGIYSHQVISPGDNVLELCSGDGFYTYYFFSGKASHVDALDIDDNALEHARRHHSSSNIQYYRSNIVLDPFPEVVAVFET